MKALTVRQPWADLIISGAKDVENRSWSTKYRGPLAIHAASAVARASDVEQWCPDGVYGRAMSIRGLKNTGIIVGTVELVDVVQDSSSPWAILGHHHWILANPQSLIGDDVPVKGRLGLWEWE